MKHTILINGRDLELFSYLFRFKVATAGQIERDIYNDRSFQATYKRLHRMVESGYLTTQPCQRERLEMGFSLTRKSFQEFTSLGCEKIIKLKSDKPNHDCTLVDIAHHFRRSAQVQDFVTENILTAGWAIRADDLVYLSDIRPDALVHAQLKRGLYYLPLEYEASSKYKGRYVDLLRRYYFYQDIAAVLYIARSESILKRVQNVEAEVAKNKEPKFFYKTLEDLETDPRLKFTDINGHGIILNRLKDAVETKLSDSRDY